MVQNLGRIPLGTVIPIHFPSYSSAGASLALSGLAESDIEVYKGVSITQRSSDAGYALIDTDGIDIDGMVGAAGISIDTGDNTDAGFYAVGSMYNVWISSVTIDSQIVNIHLATFTLVPAEASAGVQKVDMSHQAGAAFGATGGPLSIIRAGTAQAVGTNTITLDAGASDEDDVYNNLMVRIPSATTGAQQTGIIIDYDGTSKVALMRDDWVVSLTGIVTFQLLYGLGISPSTPAEQASSNRTEMDNASAKLAAILEDTGTTLPSLLPGSVTDIANAIKDNVVEGTITWNQAFMVMIALLGGNAEGLTGTPKIFRNPSTGTVARITMTFTNGNDDREVTLNFS